MYYKVIKNNKVIDVLDHLKYFKWQPKHKIMLLTDMSDAQVVLSSDESTFWHTETLYKLPDDAPEFDTVEIFEISQSEYKQLRMFGCRTLDEVLDEYTLLLIQEGII
jgi:hypothetical protein